MFKSCQFSESQSNIGCVLISSPSTLHIGRFNWCHLPIYHSRKVNTWLGWLTGGPGWDLNLRPHDQLRRSPKVERFNPLGHGIELLSSKQLKNQHTNSQTESSPKLINPQRLQSTKSRWKILRRPVSSVMELIHGVCFRTSAVSTPQIRFFFRQCAR